jgi:hypothetical protein
MKYFFAKMNFLFFVQNQSTQKLSEKLCNLIVRLVPGFRQTDRDEDGADCAQAGVQPEGSVEPHVRHHQAVQRRQDEVDLENIEPIQI